MDLGIRGKVAMVAAGSKGLGRAAALALAAEGCAVSVCGRDPKALDKAKADLEALGVAGVAVAADVSQAEDLSRWHRATETALGPVDILITNTGGPKAAVFADLTDGDWAAGVESTLMNVVRMSRLVLPGMRSRKWGRIVHITSLVAKQPLSSPHHQLDPAGGALGSDPHPRPGDRQGRHHRERPPSGPRAD